MAILWTLKANGFRFRASQSLPGRSTGSSKPYVLSKLEARLIHFDLGIVALHFVVSPLFSVPLRYNSDLCMYQKRLTTASAHGRIFQPMLLSS